MTFSVMFSVYGDAVGKARARHRFNGKFVQSYTPQKTRTYESEVAMMAKAAMGSQKPIEGPVTLFMYVNVTVPQSYSKKRREACLSGLERPAKKPDLSNIQKSIEDGMNGIVYLDDSQIVATRTTKRYDEIASVHIVVKEASIED
jgi:Holliday junction resolvase RusA-like endonuclease